MTDAPLPAQRSNFDNKDEVIWQKLEEHNVLDEIFSLLSSVPKWVKISFVGGKTSPRVYAYAPPGMSDEEAIKEKYAINPEWMSVRKEMIPLVKKYQVSRSASINRDESSDPNKGLPAPEEVAKVEEEIKGEIIDMDQKRQEAQKQQEANLKKLKKKKRQG